jgi:mono/diheme cytochrome c family protein
MGSVFARSCARCHSPGGEAGVDLSTSAAWDAHKAAILKRVVVARSMPPDGAPGMPEADRAAVKRWAEAP